MDSKLRLLGVAAVGGIALIALLRARNQRKETAAVEEEAAQSPAGKARPVTASAAKAPEEPADVDEELLEAALDEMEGA